MRESSSRISPTWSGFRRGERAGTDGGAAMLTALFQSGRIIDVILVVVVLEVAVLAAWPRLRGSLRLVDVAALVAPGVMLMLALRTVLTGEPETMTAALLAAAFVFHLWDVSRRRKGAARRSDKTSA